MKGLMVIGGGEIGDPPPYVGEMRVGREERGVT